MKKVKAYDKEFKIFINNEEIQKAVQNVADSIEKDMHDKNPLFLIILNGAFIFASDLIRRFEFDCEVSFVKLSSYSGTKSTSMVRELIGLDHNLRDRNVVIVEDIIDTGVTMEYTVHQLKSLGANEVKIATLLFKPGAFQKDYRIDYIGMKIPNDFIIGYGLDYDGYGRNYPDIYTII